MVLIIKLKRDSHQSALIICLGHTSYLHQLHTLHHSNMGSFIPLLCLCSAPLALHNSYIFDKMRWHIQIHTTNITYTPHQGWGHTHVFHGLIHTCKCVLNWCRWVSLSLNSPWRQELGQEQCRPLLPVPPLLLPSLIVHPSHHHLIHHDHHLFVIVFFIFFYFVSLHSS